MTVLLGDDLNEGQRPGKHDHGSPTKDERDFVADHLGDGAHGAEQRIFVAAGPTAIKTDSSVDAPTAKKKRMPASRSMGTEVATERQNGVGEQRWEHEHDWCKKVDQLVGIARDNVLLGHHFEARRRQLEQTVTGLPVWAEAILDAAKAFAFEPGRERKQTGKHQHDGCDGQHHGNKGLDDAGRTARKSALDPGGPSPRPKSSKTTL